MPRAKIKSAPRTRCRNCRRLTPEYDIIHCLTKTGSRDLCSPCFSAEIARSAGIAFEHLQFEPVELTDSGGVPHLFHFSTHLFGPGVAIEAFEVRHGRRAGYQFEIIGDPRGDLLALLAKLIARMQRAAAVKHLEDSEYGLKIAGHTVRGAIAYDPDSESSQPIVVIDGREIPWWLLGQMLMTFEGFHFKLEIRDKSEEL